MNRNHQVVRVFPRPCVGKDGLQHPEHDDSLHPRNTPPPSPQEGKPAKTRANDLEVNKRENPKRNLRDTTNTTQGITQLDRKRQIGIRAQEKTPSTPNHTEPV